MKLRAVWDFIAGESRLAPIGVAVAIAAAVALHRYLPGAAQGFVAFAFVTLVALSLVAGVFEKV